MTAFTCELHRPVTPVETLRLPRTAEIIKQKKHSFRNLLLVIHYSKLSIYVPFFSLCVYLYPTISPQIQYTFYSNCLFFSRPQTRSVCSKGRRLSGWSARVPGGRAPSRQRCATADSGSASDDRRRGAAIPGGGKRVRSLVTVKLKARERQCGGRDGSACGCERPPHSRTLTPTDARTLTHAHAHSHTPAYTTHVLTAHSHPPTRSHTHTHTPPTHTPHALTYTLTHSHSHTHAHHAHTHTRTLTHTPTHTHPCAAMIRLTSTATKRAGGTVTLAGSSETRGAVARGGSECGFGVCRPAVYQMRD